jgi:CRP-like cAMP-binding protein
VSSLPTPGKLSPDLLQALHGIKSVRLFPKGAKLFQQGVVATGVCLVESGEVRVLLPTGESQKQLLEVVGPGTMLGLSESISGER